MKRAVALLTVFALVGCTDTGSEPGRFAPALRLVSYNSCDDLLPKVRAAAKQSVGPWGFMNYQGRGMVDWAMPPAMSAEQGGDANSRGQAKAPVPGQDYSGTNTHEAMVDEPDLVKTDGKRIVLVMEDSLHVIDAVSHRRIAQFPLRPGAFQLLMHGDRILVLSQAGNYRGGPATDARLMYPGPYSMTTRIELFDLSEAPKSVGEYSIDASLVDARQTGSTARIVVRNYPDIVFPALYSDKVDAQLAKNRSAIDEASIDNWLPTYTLNGKPDILDCSDVSLPDEFSGASLVTVLSFDLGAGTLTNGDPTAVFADGDTVYGSEKNLYLAHDQSWRAWRGIDAWGGVQYKQSTEVYQFDITAAKPAYVASGSFSGWLLNQYSLSEYDDVLRVASTNSPPWQATERSSSTVYTLGREAGKLVQLGSVGGLGKGERIYAVRFVGPIGYVVTFRQTDPLYTVDLRNPRRPRVTGELKIPGYSAYLHPVGEDRLIGLGQDATDRGRVTGTQISLFDVSKLDDPQRLDQFKIARAYSEAESDPHAFLYWPKTRLLVVPVNDNALLMRVEDTKLVELNWISHGNDMVRRSLVIGDTLWTISHRSVVASTLDGEEQIAKILL